MTARALQLLLAASLALYALPAHAYRVLVTVPSYPGTSSSLPDWRGYTNNQRSIADALRTDGVQYDVWRGNQLTNAEVIAAAITRGGVTRTYDAIMVTEFSNNKSHYLTGFDPAVLTLRANWPAVPVLFVGAHLLNNWISNAAACSTGVTNGAFSPFGTFPGVSKQSYSRSLYVTGDAGAWKWPTDSYMPLRLQTSVGPDSCIVRPLVQSAVALSLGAAGATCTDCDGMTRSAADSAAMWRRTRGTVGRTAELGSAQIFVFPTVNGAGASANVSSGLIAMAIAALDSATRLTGSDSNPKVIGSRAGWHPRRLAIGFTHAGGHSSGAAESFDGEAGGVLMPLAALGTDSTLFKATLIDSLNSLGVPLSFWYNADRDTVATYPHELAWYRAVKLARFAPSITRGIYAQPATAFASQSGPADIFGRVRPRLLADSSLTATTCIGDTSLYCQLKNATDYCESLFPGRRLRAILPPAWDWVPANYRRGYLPDQDSLVTIFTRLGYTTLLVSPESAEQAPGATHVLQAGGSTFPLVRSNPSGLFAGERTVSGHRDFERTVSGHRDFERTEFVGPFKFRATRGRMGEASSLNLHNSAGHVWSEEFLWGAMSNNGPWYGADYRMYYHYFNTRLSMLEIPVSLLYGDGRASTKRYGWWQAKWTVNQIKAVNRLAGRDVIVLTYADDL